MTKTILRLPESGHLTERERERGQKWSGRNFLSIPQLVQDETSFSLKTRLCQKLVVIAPQAGLNKRLHLPSGLFSLQRDHSLAAPPPQERSRRREKVAHRTCSAAVLCSRDAPQVSKTDVLNRCLAAWPGRMLRRQAVLSTVHEYVAPSPGPYGPFVIEYIKHILFLCSPW